MLEKMKSAWRIPELRKKIIYTFGMLLLYRLLCCIPVPGVNIAAVSEAVTNAIVHGYRGTCGRIDLVVRLLPEREIYIRVKDCGCGIADIKKAMEPLFTTAPEEERSGLGFSVMESFMDKISVRSDVGRGTTVTMRKKLSVHGC